VSCGLTTVHQGISHAYGGALSALSVTYTLAPLDEAGAGAERRWKERELVVAVYPDRREVLADDERTVTGDFAAFH
jgi:hypothetical protein